MIRPLFLVSLASVSLLGAVAGCKTPTEVVIKLETMGGTPSEIDVRLHRSIPYNDNPMATPAFVKTFIDGADLVLEVTPAAPETVISLLPSKTGPSDLMVSVTAAGFASDPSTAQDGTFAENVSKTLTFTLTALPPDMGAPDMATKHDLAHSGDLSASGDLSGTPPTDGASKGD